MVNGWSVSQTDRDIEYKVTDNMGNDVETSLELRKRQDLYKLRLTDKKHILCGFKATFLYEEDKEYTLKVSDTVDEKMWIWFRKNCGRLTDMRQEKDSFSRLLKRQR